VKNSLLYFSLFFVLAGCETTKWWHPTLGESDFYRDSALCNQYAAVSNPSNAPAFNPYLTPIQQANAMAYSGGADMGRAYGMSVAFQNCMLAKGYRKQ
jgi:hypothetical protein